MTTSIAGNPASAVSAADASSFRRVMGSFATGVAVITTSHESQLHGMTVNSLTSVSLDPLIVLVCLVKGSRTGEAIRECGRFGINFLTESQEEVSRRFVSKEVERFEEGHYRESGWGIPLLEGGLAHIVCDVHSIQEVGDHLVLFGRVLECEAGEGKPLLFWRGKYSTLHQSAAN